MPPIAARSISGRLRTDAPTSGTVPCTSATSSASTSAKWPISTSMSTNPEGAVVGKDGHHSCAVRCLSMSVIRAISGNTFRSTSCSLSGPTWR